MLLSPPMMKEESERSFPIAPDLFEEFPSTSNITRTDQYLKLSFAVISRMALFPSIRWLHF